MQDFNHN